MTDVFEARVVSVDGCAVVIDVLSEPAGVLDLCASRSFALLLLADALRRSIDFIPWSDPERAAKATKVLDRDARAPLVRALANEDMFNEDWMRAHVGLYIASCTLLERRNHLDEAALIAIDDEITAQFGGTLLTEQHALWAPVRWARCHSFTLKIVVTHPRLVEHLQPGLAFPTTAGDVWFERA